MGLSNELSCGAGSLSCCHKPHWSSQPEVLRLFPALEPWVVQSVLLPVASLPSPFSPQANVGPTSLPAAALPAPDLENVMVSEMSQSEKDTYHVI